MLTLHETFQTIPTHPPYVLNIPSPKALSLSERRERVGVQFAISNTQERDENGKCRTELRLHDPTKSAKIFYADPNGANFWSAREFYVPEASWNVAYPHKILISQWHHKGGSELGKMPPIQIFLWKDKLYVREVHSNSDGEMGQYRDLYKQPFVRGRWTRIVTHIKWDWRGKGIFEAWLDGKPMFAPYRGRTGFQFAPGAYESVGLYCPSPVDGLSHRMVFGLWQRSATAIAP